MPPTPQHSFQQMAPVASPQQTAVQALAMPQYANHNHGYNMSFDPTQHQQQPVGQVAQGGFAHSFPNGPMSNPGFTRSFGEGKKGATRGGTENPQIYTAVYSGVSVYELEVGGVACMRRRGDGWLNATQILKVAGVEKGKRTKVLEKEILTGEHEKVQGGYGKYQGTWVSYQRGREFCRQYGVEDILRPLLDYDVHPDGSGGDGQETPTKEQAMAAQRKRFYNANQEQRPSGQGSFAGTFFQNISPTASVALAAMSKVQRLNSPAPRPSSAQQQKPSNMRHSSQPNAELPPESQQSNVSESTDNVDSGYGTQVQGEPPRKRMRTDDGHDGMGPPALPFDTSIVSATPTEPNESFIYDNALMMESKNGAGEPIALAPLPSPATEEQQEKMNLILDLFAEQGRMDYSSHPALTQLSNDDFNMPLDASANNALHWAATLAKVSLLKLLIQRGASIWRGNAAGQSPLISAVLVNNCWEHSCFPELLELLGPLIEVRDLQGRTILHHIAVSSGIKGRSPSSKYYLEALLEFLVRTGQANSSQVTTNVAAAAAAGLSESSQEANGESSNLDPSLNLGQPRGPITFVKFLQSIVNARDKAGNSALNLAARINNRSIIQQLLEIHADPSLPNNKGISAKDFGIGSETMEPTQSDEMFDASQPTSQLQVDPAFQRSMMASQNGESQLLNSASQVEEMGQDVISSMTSMLTQNLASHKELLRSRSEQIDRVNSQIQDLSSLQKTTLDELYELKDRVRLREERKAKLQSLQREVQKKRTTASRRPRNDNIPAPPQWLDASNTTLFSLSSTPDGQPAPAQLLFAKTTLPPSHILRAHLTACNKNISSLQDHAKHLHSRSTEIEEMYRKVVALCTGVPEDKVEESLPSLVAAIESETQNVGEQDVGRVRDFLRKVEGGGGAASGNGGMLQNVLEVNPTVTALAQAAAAVAAAAAR